MGLSCLLCQAVSGEEKPKTKPRKSRKSNKVGDEPPKKRKHTDGSSPESPVPPPQVIGVPSIVEPFRMLVPQGKLKSSPPRPPAPGAGVIENPSVVVVPVPMPSLPNGFTFTRVDPEEPDHQDETPQVKYLGAFSDFLLTSSFFRCPSSSLTKGRWPRRIPTLRTKPLR